MLFEVNLQPQSDNDFALSDPVFNPYQMESSGHAQQRSSVNEIVQLNAGRILTNYGSAPLNLDSTFAMIGAAMYMFRNSF